MSDMAAGQLWGYGISVAAGACSGVLGSLFWFISKLFRNSRAVAWICDITLWLILSVVVMAVSYICCDGDLRLYIFLGFFSSFLLVFFTFLKSKIKVIKVSKLTITSRNVKIKYVLFPRK
jgi:hypothetical protein